MTPAPRAFLEGGGATGALIRAHDWEAEGLGAPETWPASLRTAVELMLNAAHPVFIAWGPRLTSFYNDHYLPIAGARHPGIGLPFEQLWADLWADLRPLIDVTLGGRAQHFTNFELRLADRDGEPGWFTFTYTPLRDDSGAVAGLLCAATETTDDVRARRDRDELTARQLHEARKIDALGHLTGSVAHDFNNLLTPVIAGLDLLRRRHDDPASRRLTDAALASAERAKSLVGRLLSFARRRTPEVRPLDVASIVEGMRDLLERSVGPAVRLAVDIPPGLPPVLADVDQLELALLNLAVNARDAMPSGGTLTITAAAGGGQVAISLSDTGTGMDAATLARAHEPFFSTKPDGRGTGLGLSTVRSFATDSGGSLTLDSAPGLGTTATLRLPTAGVAPIARPARDEEPRPGGNARVLLVDDDEAARASVGELLRDLGYAVEEAAGGEAALARLAGGWRPDLLVTDQLMPGMTGAALAARMRASAAGLPVLLITGAGEPADGADGLALLAKPFRHSDLATAVADLLAQG